MSKTFCILPYIHAQTKPNGQIKPCCRFDHKHPDYKTDHGFKFDKFNINDEDMSFTQALESEEWQEIRELMANNEKVPGCRKCYQEEEFEFNNNYKNPRRRTKSLRHKENWTRNNKNLNQPEDSTIKIRYLEITMGNHCNLKCRMCASDLSAMWLEDDTELAKYYKDRKPVNIVNIEKAWNREDFANIEEIKFTGGEPMLHPNFIHVLDMLIDSGRADLITLDIFTNASWVPKDKVISRLNKFNKVFINLSVDGIGRINDYIRYPSEWTIVEEAVGEWLSLEKEHSEKYIIKWVPCISVYNVWHFHKMIEWWFALQKKYKDKDWWEEKNYMVNILHDPEYLKPALYPSRKLLIEKLLAHKESLLVDMIEKVTDVALRHEIELNLNTMYNKVISAINEEIKDIEEKMKTFIEYTADLDRLRGQNIQTNIYDLWKRFEGKIEYKGRINE